MNTNGFNFGMLEGKYRASTQKFDVAFAKGERAS